MSTLSSSTQAFNILLLLWAVCGGLFITNFILSNWLAILVNPVFEDPVDTALVSRNTLFEECAYYCQ